jgi:ATP-grasp ribosomal peptide maturase
MDEAILVLTQEIDPTSDFVIRELARRDANVIRFDIGDFPSGTSLLAEIDSSLVDWAGRLDRPRRSIGWGQIKSVWWRRPTYFRFPEHLSREERRFARDEAAAAIGGLLRLQDAFWMNHPERTAGADFKPVQLKAARQCGLEIPRTLITNRVEDACAFIRSNAENGRRTIYKTLAYSDVVNPVTGSDEVIYTTVVEESQLEDDELVRVSPCMFQEEVPKRLELRVTVVQDRVLTAGIDAAGSAAARVDFRAGYEELRYEPYELPDDLAKSLVNLVRDLGLTFAAIDLILTPDGRHVFLELNPAGQWAWLELELGLPISEAIADALQDGEARSIWRPGDA